MTGVELDKIVCRVKDDVRKFYKFKERSILMQMFLHLRRRARLMVYFAF